MTFSPFTSARELAAAVRDGSISPVELTELHISRIERHNPALHAIVVNNQADARRTARERDADLRNGVVRGPLHGLPITVKESFNVAGLKTTVNLPQLKDNVAGADALVVERARAAGGCILGKTNVPTMLSDFQSFGPLYPTATNPYDLTRTPGGSTGGGAAAIAAGLTTLEFGSDIGGSIRLPAHFCGVFGLKPTETAAEHGQGHVPPPPGAQGGFVAMASMGPLARTMDDIELAWRVINVPAWSRSAHLPQKPRTTADPTAWRVGWFDDAGMVACGEETRAALASFVGRLQAAGIACERQPFEQRWLDEAYAVWALLFGTILGQDASWIVRRIMSWQLSRLVRGATLHVLPSLRAGLGLDFKRFSAALRRRDELIGQLQHRFDGVDFIISPTAAGPAFAHNPKHAPVALDNRMLGYLDYVMPFTLMYNTCGNPVLVVPAGRTAGNLPIGLQIAAPHYAEDDLIHFGRFVERLGATFLPPPGYD
jgi:amidase